jgi:hypothetical protein
MVNPCNIKPGQNLYVDLTATSNGNGHYNNPWNDLNTALDNIGSFNTNFRSFIYLNIKADDGSGGINIYDIDQSKLTFISNLVLRSYSSGTVDPATDEPVGGWTPTTDRPIIKFTHDNYTSVILSHLDNFGLNNVIIEVYNSGTNDIGSLVFTYSYLQCIDTDFYASLNFLSTRMNIDNVRLDPSNPPYTIITKFLTNADSSNIILSAGAMLIIGTEQWTLNGDLNVPNSIQYNGGVLISGQEIIGTSPEPIVDPYAIGYYSSYNSVAIELPDYYQRNDKNMGLYYNFGTNPKAYWDHFNIKRS